jgi:hypothetical protein
MQARSILLLLPLVLSTPGCFLSRGMTNEPVRRALVDQLVPGESTAGDATRLLGAPNEVVQLGNRSAYRFDFTTLKRAGFSIFVVTVFNEDTRSDRVWLFFDAQDRLTHVGKTFEGDSARYAMPWQKVH